MKNNSGGGSPDPGTGRKSNKKREGWGKGREKGKARRDRK